MDAERWRRVEDLYSEAMARPAAERLDFIRRASAGDQALADEVVSLVEAAATDPNFLSQPLIAPSRPDLPGEPRRIGRYRLVRTLGRGGMGEVFLGVQEGDDFERSVAVKLIRHGVESDDVSRRFAQERRILARLRHPNIASLLDGGTSEDGTSFVVMEFVDGVRLDRYCESRKLDESARVELMLQVCEAVQHAHRNLVIHRDLKPANILVTDDGVPMLLDFGIGKLLDTGEDSDQGSSLASPETRTGMRVLTPEYAAPEQIRGAPVTTASDVFALGVILHELLAGVLPWSGLGDAERLAAIEYGLPTRMSVGEGGEGRLSGDLRMVLAKALRFEPDRRYPTVDAFAEDLRRSLEGRPVSARPDTLGYRTARFVRRNRAAVLTSTAVLATLLVATTSVLEQRASAAERVASERDKLRETQGFLLEMFGAVGPDESPGSEVSARALLDAQSSRIGQYDDQPDVQAEIQLVLADGYQRLGLVDEAYPLAVAALETRRSLLDDDDPEVARARSLLGWIERERGDADAAESLLRAAINSFRAPSQPTPGSLSKALNDLGVVLGDQGRQEEAATVLEEALALRRTADGDAEGRAVGITASNLASAYQYLGRRDEAQALMEEAIAALEGDLGPAHGRVWLARANLLAFGAGALPPEERVAGWREHLGRAEEVFGGEHRETAWALYQLGVSLFQAAAGPEGAANMAESRETLARAVAVADRTFGPEHPRTAAILVGQATLQLLERDYEASISTRRRALEIFSAAYGPDHPDIGYGLRDMSRAYYGLGQAEEGDRLAREAWEHHVRVLGPDDVYTLVQQVNLARRLTVTGAAEEAADLLSEAADGVDRLDPPQPGLGFQARISLARALARTGDSERADSILEAVRPQLDEVSASLARSWEQIAREVAEGGGSTEPGQSPS